MHIQICYRQYLHNCIQRNIKYMLLNNKIKTKLKIFIFLTKIFTIIQLTNTASVAPTQHASPECWGAHHLKFISSTEISSPGFTDAQPVFSFTRNLGKIYKDVKSLTSCITSFKSQVNYYLGYQLHSGFSGNPTISVQVNFTVLQNSSLSLVGVSVLVICDPLAKILTVLDYVLETILVYEYVNITMPALFNYYGFVKSWRGKSSGTQLKINPIDFLPSATSLGLRIANSPFAMAAGYDYQIQVIVLLFDNTKKSTLPELSSVSWANYQWYDAVFPTLTFNINIAVNGKDFHRRCLIGFHRIDMLNGLTPYFLFDLDPAIGVVNGSHNAGNNWWKTNILCMRTLVCPATYPFTKLGNTSCFDCAVGIIVNTTQFVPLDALCNVKNYLYEYDADYQLSKVCFICNGCEDHYFAQNFTCHSCGILFLNCLTCQQKVKCLTCITGYTLDSQDRCAACAASIPDCQECAGLTCTLCFPEYFLNGNVCYLCQSYWSGCYSCTSSAVCDTCYPNYYMEISLCYKCQDFMFQCASCTSNTTCLACNWAYELDSAGNCVEKQSGCVSLVNVDGDQSCIACNNDAGFAYNPIKKLCECPKGLKLSETYHMASICIAVCGDGFKRNSESCDDGNNLDNDGCSSTCTVETFYLCSDDSPSKCVLYKDFTYFQHEYVQKVKGQNKANMVFSLLPPFKGLESLDWSKMLTLSIDGKDVDKSLYTAEYSSETGTIKVIFSYTETLEYLTVKCHIQFQPSLLVSIPSSLEATFTVKGINEPIIFESAALLKTYEAASMISLLVMGAMMLQFFAGSYLHKMIGLETIQVAQLVYFVRILIKREHASFLNGINEFRHAAFGGYNDFQMIFNLPKTTLITQQAISGLTNQLYSSIDLQKYFLLNVNFSLIPLALVLIGYSFYLTRKYMARTQFIETGVLQAKDHYTLLKRSSEWIYDSFFFPYVMLFNFLLLQNTVYCLQTTTKSQLQLQQNTSNSDFDRQLLKMTVLSFTFQSIMFFLNLGIYCYQVFQSYQAYTMANMTQKQKVNNQISPIEKLQYDKNDLNTKRNYHPLYCLIYLVYYLLINLTIILQINFIDQFQYGLEVITAITGLYFIFICCWKPYFDGTNSHNYFLKLNHFSTFLFLIIFLMLQRFQNLESNIIIITMSAVSILLIIIMTGGFIRLFIQYRFNILVDQNLVKQVKKKEVDDSQFSNLKNYLESNKTNQYLFKNQIRQFYNKNKRSSKFNDKISKSTSQSPQLLRRQNNKAQLTKQMQGILSEMIRDELKLQLHNQLYNKKLKRLQQLNSQQIRECQFQDEAPVGSPQMMLSRKYSKEQQKMDYFLLQSN